ncbi:MAG TPA: glucoamylase family protein [Kofleriaceae bacterium]|nr:glucoamylase family protein [Kofleriaceae bacterium]
MGSERRLIAAAALAIAASCSPSATPDPRAAAPGASAASASDDAMLDELERRTFDYFWRTADPATGLVPDRSPTPSFSSIAAVGFGLTAYAIGSERGYVSRAAARDRVLATLRFFSGAPQGDAAEGVTGYHGFYYHFLDMATGRRYKDVELSSVDTALLLAGVLFCREYFAGGDPAEAELRQIADQLLERADWRWISPRAPRIAMGWQPGRGFLDHDWVGYNEAMIVILLALGSPTFAVDPAAWDAWSARYDQAWGAAYGQTLLGFPPLFGHQYSHVWVDFRGVADRFMRAHGLDYFENSRRATLAQRSYAIANPGGWAGYGANVWGLTACDGPGEMTVTIGGAPRALHGYEARGMAQNDDGTLAPTAMVSSLPFAPEVVLPGIRELERRWGAAIYRAYGFVDAFNPSFPPDARPEAGSVVPGAGWVDVDYLGIDEGPIVAMIENHRSGLVWKVMRGSAYLRRALGRAGFTGGWLEAAR